MDKAQIPDFVTKYFWGDDAKQLDLTKNHKYIIMTILERGDSKAIKWIFSIFTHNEIKELLPDTKLSKKSANFWTIYLS